MKNLRQFTLPLIFLGLIAIYNQSCCRGDCDDEPIDTNELAIDTVFNNDTFLSYWYFPEGSWWVYKRTDTTADIYDTATVTRTYRAFKPRSRAVEKLYENLIMDISHSSKYVQRPIQSSTKHINSLSTNGVNVLAMIGGGTYFLSDIYLKWPIELGSVNGGLTTILDTNSINLEYLNKTLSIVHLSPGYTHETYESHIWLCNNIGFVKYRLYNNTEWELFDYYINK